MIVMNILLCDEEKEKLDLWIHIIKEVMDDCQLHIDTCTSLVKAKQYIQNDCYDLVLLKTPYHQEKRIDFAKEILHQKKDCAIIFIGDGLDYIHEMFEIKIFQYIHDQEDIIVLKQELVRFYHIYKKQKARCMIHTAKGIQTFFPHEIFYIETRNRKVSLVTSLGVFEGVVNDLNKMKKKLEEFDFYQIHQSYFLNLNAIVSMKKGEVTLRNGDTIPTSILNRNIIKNRIHLFLKTP